MIITEKQLKKIISEEINLLIKEQNLNENVLKKISSNLKQIFSISNNMQNDIKEIEKNMRPVDMNIIEDLENSGFSAMQKIIDDYLGVAYSKDIPHPEFRAGVLISNIMDNAFKYLKTSEENANKFKMINKKAIDLENELDKKNIPPVPME
jgi:hypothetical protein